MVYFGKKARKVNQYTLEGKFIKTYRSINEAARQTKSKQGNICRVCQGKHKQHNNFIWKYTKE